MRYDIEIRLIILDIQYQIYVYDPYGFDNSVNLTDDNQNRHYFYDQNNHLVIIVGWVSEENTVDGVTKNETFWIMQNSWGINQVWICGLS
ncbi:Dipeptidyl-peptidase_I [Hexamita inflata]|uniref:Dipeptidyl-peptidase_I n=1 Tax=Hexamita inflata TaxID=28002 RepID=A0ABP1KH85_9EUKA